MSSSKHRRSRRTPGQADETTGENARSTYEKTPSDDEQKRSASPPHYRVYEDLDGKLVNNKYNVVWPQRPPIGPHSMNAYKKKKCKAKPPAQPTASKSQRDKNFLHGKQPDEAPLSSVSSCVHTAPSYSVSQDENGQLINSRLKVTWPNRPTHGPHSKAAYKHCREKERHTPERVPSVAAVSSSTSSMAMFADSTYEVVNPIDAPSSLKGHFLGIVSISQVYKVLRATNFAFYYERAERIGSLDEVPVGMPLKLAYKSADEIVTLFDVCRVRTSNGADMWQLKRKSAVLKQPLFKNLSTLVQHYTVHARDLDIRAQEDRSGHIEFD